MEKTKLCGQPGGSPALTEFIHIAALVVRNNLILSSEQKDLNAKPSFIVVPKY
jgi:hypothetical protein